MYKKERLAEQLQSFLAAELRKLHDQRLSLITLVEVRPSSDYKSARIFWTHPEALCSTAAEQKQQEAHKKNRAEVQKLLESKVAYLKRQIAQGLTLRYVPDLQFEFDESVERGSRIDELLKKAGY